MPLMPKRTKYRKQQKGRIRGKASRGNRVTDGEYGLQSLELGHITFEEWERKSTAYKAKLDKIKITPIKYIQFTKLIKKIKNGELE